MKGLAAAFLVWTLLSPKGGGSQAWPTHTACKDGGLEVLYQSCDPLQDFGFSVDQCSRHLKSNLSIRFGMILREDIKELFLDVSLFSEGLSILSYSYPICEEDLPKFSFCGRKRGEQIYYAGPVNNPGFDIPKPYSGFQNVNIRNRTLKSLLRASGTCSCSQGPRSQAPFTAGEAALKMRN
ncbi:lymphocyte antigen 86 isoform X1 [Phyllostomus hastatus]|uniref:lymphocyte antigen 86 isoform X1 n=1 Tax=Phyllostomus hastatus TaxID=9423 RepID=UPI001E67E7C9|nr:lymphocyte antigen 86 isoform X1 [Phyllostomus hastatus]